MNRLAVLVLASASALLNIDTALAVNVNAGTFTVTQQCEAFRSFKNRTNPDDLAVAPGQTLPIAEVNREQYQWVRVDLGKGKPELRWVSADCGQVAGLEIAQSGTQACRIPDQYDSYVLATSWQPGFCVHDKNGPGKPECQAISKGELQVDHFTLHGLWPNKRSCGIDYGNCAGTRLDLDPATVDYIKPWMPNFNFGNAFGSYEWNKHGVCQTVMNDDDYFRFAVDLVKSFNDSPAGRYVRENSGGTVSRQQFYAKLAEEYGSAAAGNHFLLLCSGDYLEEIRVALPKDFKGARSVRGVIGQDFLATRNSDRNECRGDSIRIQASKP